MGINIELIEEIKQCICLKEYELGEKKAAQALEENPDSPIVHNLMGIILEKQSKHVQAIKHFRTAYTLDSTYIPVIFNMRQYGIFYPVNDPEFSDERWEGNLKHGLA